MTAAYEAFVFDFFGVVCSEVAPFWFRKYLPEPESIEVKSRLVGPADKGEISQEELFTQLGQFAGMQAKQVQDEWWGYVSINRDVVDLAKELGKRYRVALLTNATSGFFREIMKRNHLDGIFDPVVISSVERAAKPDRVIYERVLDRMNVPAGRALMIDDNPTNILGAQSAGMDGIVFESAARLKNILAERGCLIGVPGYRS